jgi:ketosteroid isomerase-like protein
LKGKQVTQPPTLILDRYLAACQTLDYDLITSCFTETAKVRDPAGTYNGRHEVHAYFAGIYRELVALEFKLGKLYWRANSCAVQWEGRATQRDGVVKHYEGIDVFTLRPDGYISDMQAYWDPSLLVSNTTISNVPQQ